MDEFERDFVPDMSEILERAKEPSPSMEHDDFSFERWQPLIDSIRPFLAEEVERLGISVQGKSEMDLVKEVFTAQKNIKI